MLNSTLTLARLCRSQAYPLQMTGHLEDPTANSSARSSGLIEHSRQKVLVLLFKPTPRAHSPTSNTHFLPKESFQRAKPTVVHPRLRLASRHKLDQTRPFQFAKKFYLNVQMFVSVRWKIWVCNFPYGSHSNELIQNLTAPFCRLTWNVP